MAASAKGPALVPVGAHAGKPIIPLSRPVTLVGSRNTARIHLVSRSVSKAHALIVIDGGRVYVRDLAARVTTEVNDEPITERWLTDGDELRIGKFLFRFMAGTARHETDQLPAAALTAVDGDAAHPVEGLTLLIGRRDTCDLPLSDDAVSTAHAVIFRREGRRYLRDLGSRTGTRVNGEAIRESELSLGDTLGIGHADFRYDARTAEADLVAMPIAEDVAADVLVDEGIEDEADLAIDTGDDLSPRGWRATAADAPAPEADAPVDEGDLLAALAGEDTTSADTADAFDLESATEEEPGAVEEPTADAEVSAEDADLTSSWDLDVAPIDTDAEADEVAAAPTESIADEDDVAHSVTAAVADADDTATEDPLSDLASAAPTTEPESTDDRQPQEDVEAEDGLEAIDEVETPPVVETTDEANLEITPEAVAGEAEPDESPDLALDDELAEPSDEPIAEPAVPEPAAVEEAPTVDDEAEDIVDRADESAAADADAPLELLEPDTEASTDSDASAETHLPVEVSETEDAVDELADDKVARAEADEADAEVEGAFSLEGLEDESSLASVDLRGFAETADDEDEPAETPLLQLGDEPAFTAAEPPQISDDAEEIADDDDAPLALEGDELAEDDAAAEGPSDGTEPIADVSSDIDEPVAAPQLPDEPELELADEPAGVDEPAVVAEPAPTEAITPPIDEAEEVAASTDEETTLREAALAEGAELQEEVAEEVLPTADGGVAAVPSAEIEIADAADEPAAEAESAEPISAEVLDPFADLDTPDEALDLTSAEGWDLDVLETPAVDHAVPAQPRGPLPPPLSNVDYFLGGVGVNLSDAPPMPRPAVSPFAASSLEDLYNDDAPTAPTPAAPTAAAPLAPDVPDVPDTAPLDELGQSPLLDDAALDDALTADEPTLTDEPTLAEEAVHQPPIDPSSDLPAAPVDDTDAFASEPPAVDARADELDFAELGPVDLDDLALQSADDDDGVLESQSIASRSLSLDDDDGLVDLTQSEDTAHAVGMMDSVAEMELPPTPVSPTPPPAKGKKRPKRKGRQPVIESVETSVGGASLGDLSAADTPVDVEPFTGRSLQPSRERRPASLPYAPHGDGRPLAVSRDAAEEDAARQKRRMARLFVLLLLAFAAGLAGAWAGYTYWPVRATVSYEMTFLGLEGMGQNEQQARQDAIRHRMSEPTTAVTAEKTLRSRRPDVTSGFLGDVLLYARAVDESRFEPDRPHVLRLVHRGTDGPADAARVRAWADAVYAANAGLLNQRDEQQASLAEARNQLAQNERQKAEVAQQLAALRARADVAPDLRQIDQLQQQLQDADTAWERALAREKAVEAELALRATPQQAQAATDPQLAAMEDELELLRGLAQRQAEQRVEAAGDARTRYERALATLTTAADTLKRAADDAVTGAALRPFVNQVNGLSADLAGLGHRLIDEQERQLSQLAETRTQLIEEEAAIRRAILESDPRLQELHDAAAMAERRYNAAVADGATAQVSQLEMDLQRSRTMVAEREQELTAAPQGEEPNSRRRGLTGRLEEARRQLAADQAVAERQIMPLEEALSRAEPPHALTPQQRQLVDGLLAARDAASAARQSYAQAVAAASQGKAAAPQPEPQGNAAEDLAQRIGRVQSQIARRQAELGPAPQLAAEPARVAELEAQLATLQAVSTEANRAFFEAKNALRDARALYESREADSQQIATLQRRQDELDLAIRRLADEQATQARELGQTVVPQMPQGDATVVFGADHRLLAAGLGGGGMFVLMLLPALWTLWKLLHPEGHPSPRPARAQLTPATADENGNGHAH